MLNTIGNETKIIMRLDVILVMLGLIFLMVSNFGGGNTDLLVTKAPIIARLAILCL